MFADEEEIKSTILYREETEELEYDTTFYYTIYNGVKENLEEIDKVIVRVAPDWPIKNINKIDLTILRIGIFELEFLKETPKKIVIDECVELGKKFGNDSTSKFINGVLDNII